MTYSRPSLRRFIRYFLSINEPRYWFHQTLTFCPKQNDLKQARHMLNQFLSNVHKQFKAMASLHVLEDHAAEGWHFHVLFFFFADSKLPCPQSKLESRLRAAAFKAWNKLNGGRVKHCANRLTTPPAPSPHYFLKKLRALAANAPTARRPVSWWTKRNQAVFDANMTIPDERTVAATFNRYFNRRRRRRQSYRSLQSQTIGIVPPSLTSESFSALLNQRMAKGEELASLLATGLPASAAQYPAEDEPTVTRVP